MNMPVSKRRARRARWTETRGKAWMSQGRAITLWGVALALAVSLLMGITKPVTRAGLAVGQRSSVTILASTDFTCVDLDRTEMARRLAAEASLPVFAPSLMRVQDGARIFFRFFDRVRTLALNAEQDPKLQAELEDLSDLIGVHLGARDAIRLLEEPSARGNETLIDILQAVARKGILTEEERDSRFQGIAVTGAIWLDRGAAVPLAERKIEEVATPEQAATEAARLLSQAPPWNRISPESIRPLIKPWLAANLVYQPAMTDQLRRDASRLAPVVQMTVRAGATLIEAGDPATPQTLEMLREHDRRKSELLPPFYRALSLTSDIGLAVFATAMIFLLIAMSAGRRMPAPNTRVLFVTSSILTVGGIRILLWLSESGAYASPALISLALPVSISAVLVTILGGATAGILSGAWVAAMTSIFLGRSYDVMLIGLFSSVVAAVACRKVRRRGQIFQAGLWIGLTRAILVLLADLPVQQPVSILGMRMATALGVGLAESGLILLLIPMFEFALRLTSNIRLLELSDPGHPLLRRMAEEAPGSYHHSLMVAHLAEAAAEEIGANPLLARVCAYFHDIGKLTKPEYFIENIHPQSNPHDDLSPSMSNLVIQSHVKEGISLAQRYRLPPPVVDAIRQHHGTSLIACFYSRAKSQAAEFGEGAGPAPEDYRYGGPRPTHREQGILLLADSLEAASRALETVNPARIRALVDDIVSGKLKDGQLDDADLTLAELTAVQQSFAFTLANMRHGRIAYPSDENPSPESPAQPAAPVGPGAQHGRMDASPASAGPVG